MSYFGIDPLTQHQAPVTLAESNPAKWLTQTGEFHTLERMGYACSVAHNSKPDTLGHRLTIEYKAPGFRRNVPVAVVETTTLFTNDYIMIPHHCVTSFQKKGAVAFKVTPANPRAAEADCAKDTQDQALALIRQLIGELAANPHSLKGRPEMEDLRWLFDSPVGQALVKAGCKFQVSSSDGGFFSFLDSGPSIRVAIYEPRPWYSPNKLLATIEVQRPNNNDKHQGFRLGYVVNEQQGPNVACDLSGRWSNSYDQILACLAGLPIIADQARQPGA